MLENQSLSNHTWGAVPPTCPQSFHGIVYFFDSLEPERELGLIAEGAIVFFMRFLDMVLKLGFHVLMQNHSFCSCFQNDPFCQTCTSLKEVELGKGNQRHYGLILLSDFLQSVILLCSLLLRPYL